MALQRDVKYSGRYDAATSAQPQGAFKNRTSPSSEDGSYMEKDWLNDWSAYMSSLLVNAGITPNNNVDEVGASQYYDALTSLFLQQSNNLSDLDNVSTARINLGMANVVIDQGRNVNGEYRIWNNGYREQWALGTMPSGTTAPITANFPISFNSVGTIQLIPSAQTITSLVAQGITIPEADVVSTTQYRLKALTANSEGQLQAPISNIDMVIYATGF